MGKDTIVIIARNELENAQHCVKQALENMPEGEVIFVANGSGDEVLGWLEGQTFSYIIFDEGMQAYSTILNAVLDNFELEGNLIVLQAGCLIGENTLPNMMRALQEEEGIGVVGVRSNIGMAEQYVEAASFEALCRREKQESEQSGSGESDDIVVASDGICFGITKKLISVNGAFDEQYVGLEPTLIDYQLRAVQNGFQNRICSNAYIFQEKKEVDNLENTLQLYDRKSLKAAWNMNYFNLKSNMTLGNLIEQGKYDEFSVLEIGCDMGANLLGIKNRYPNCDIHGLEINENAVEIGKYVADIQYGNIEELHVPFAEKFDYIIFGDVLEHLHDPQKVIRYCRELLKDNGCILTSIPNIMHISVMQQLLNGHFQYDDVGLLDKTHIHFFTYKEIEKMFKGEDYRLEKVMHIAFPLSEEEERLKQGLLALSGDVEPFMFEAYQYVIAARMC